MIFGGIEVVDIREPDFTGTKGTVIGIAVHHTVTDEDELPENDRDAIEAIRRYHKTAVPGIKTAWPGIGYEFAIGDGGTVYYVGDVGVQRAGVWGRNHEIVSIALLGRYTTVSPPQAQLAGCARTIQALREHYKKPLPWKGHGDWALPGHGTECPGAMWPQYRVELARLVEVSRMTRDEALKLSLSQEAGLVKWLRDYWRWIFAANDWPLPPHLQ